MRFSFQTRWMVGLAILLIVRTVELQLPAWAADSDSNPAAAIVDDQEIAALIEDLGSSSYATRIRSRRQLSRIGLPAFDALRQACNHPDSEIAIVARKLTSGIEVRWSTNTDSQSVQELLNEYGSRTPSGRRRRITQLAELPAEESFTALVRLARYETEPTLGRFSALAILSQQVQPKQVTDIASRDDLRNDWADHLVAMFAGDSRTSSQWLLQYAKDLRAGQFNSQNWTDLIVQTQTNWASADETAVEPPLTPKELFQFTWLNAERAWKLGTRENASRFLEQHVDVIPSRTRELSQAAYWAIDRKLFDVVTATHQEHRVQFEKSPHLLYASAEASLRLGQLDQAKRLAEQALRLNPVVNATDDQGKAIGQALHPILLENNAESHIEVAAELVDRGLFDWSEAEHRLVIERLPITSVVASFSRRVLAEQLAEQQQHGEVVKLLTPLIDRLEKDDDFRRELMARDFDESAVRGLLNFQNGLNLAGQGKATEAAPILRAAFALDPANIDILIAMYRLELDDEWKQSVLEQLSSALSEIEQDIDEAERTFNDPRNARNRSSIIRDMMLANLYNQHAWLVSNTEGDFDKALQRSIKSLELNPGSDALLDTCGRCYYAAGNLPAAIAIQREALKLMPHSPPLNRQLRLFESAWLDANPTLGLDQLPAVELPVGSTPKDDFPSRQQRFGRLRPDGPLSFLDS